MSRAASPGPSRLPAPGSVEEEDTEPPKKPSRPTRVPKPTPKAAVTKRAPAVDPAKEIEAPVEPRGRSKSRAPTTEAKSGRRASSRAAGKRKRVETEEEEEEEEEEKEKDEDEEDEEEEAEVQEEEEEEEGEDEGKEWEEGEYDDREPKKRHRIYWYPKEKIDVRRTDRLFVDELKAAGGATITSVSQSFTLLRCV